MRIGGRAAIVFILLICAMAMGDPEAKISDPPENFARDDEETAEQAWTHCRKELVDKKDDLNDFHLHISKEAIKHSKSILLTKENIQKASFMPSHLKQRLLDCSRRKSHSFRFSGEETTLKFWFVRHLEWFFAWPSHPRRNLATYLDSHMAQGPISVPTPAPAPSYGSAPATGLAPSPSYGAAPTLSPAPAPSYGSTPTLSPEPGPSYGPAPTLSPEPATGYHFAPALAPGAASSYGSAPALSPAPAPSYGLRPASTSSPNSYFPVKASELASRFASPPPPKNSKRSPPRPKASKHPPSKKQNDILKETIIAVVATAIGTFAMVALLFFCCFRGKRNKIGPRDGRRDESPLLHLSLSDFSAGSSQNSISLGTSSSKAFKNGGKNPSIRSNFSMKSGNYDSSLAETQSEASMDQGAGPTLKPPPGRSVPPPPGPPPPPKPPGPRPPPPPKGARPPPMPPKGVRGGAPHHRGHSISSDADESDSESGAPKAKLKPFFWDKVMANPDQSMVWHEIKAGSFQFNEEMMESLFGYTVAEDKRTDRRKDSSLESSVQYIQIIDPRKAQNLSILLRALNVTIEEVVDAVQEGNELPLELLQTLLKMAPTSEEELKLRLFPGNVAQLGPAERFLKVLVEIPCAFKRIESLLFMSSLQEDISTLKESFATLEVASNKLRSSRLFLKLLEAVLKTGNRMNDGTYRGGAQAFKLDTLLKLSDVKGTDGKTTLLHFVVQEIIRSEGIRAARTAKSSRSFSSVKTDDLVVDDPSSESAEHLRSLGLQVVSGLSTELIDIKKAAIIDLDTLTSTMSKVSNSLEKTKDFLDSEMKNTDEGGEFYRALASFVERTEADYSWLLEEEKRIMALVKSTGDYFHGNSGKDEGLRLFAIVRDFLIMVDKACKEIQDTRTKPRKTYKREAAKASASSENRQQDIRKRLFPAIADRQRNSDSSDDDSSSP